MSGSVAPSLDQDRCICGRWHFRAFVDTVGCQIIAEICRITPHASHTGHGEVIPVIEVSGSIGAECDAVPSRALRICKGVIIQAFGLTSLGAVVAELGVGGIVVLAGGNAPSDVPVCIV